MEGTKLRHGDIIPGLCFKEYVAAIANLVWSIEVPARQGFEWLYLDADNLKLLPIAESTAHYFEFSTVGRRILQQFMLPFDMEGWITPDIFLCRRSKGAVVYADPCVLEHFKKVIADAAAAWLRFPAQRKGSEIFNTSDVLAFLMQCAQTDQHKLTILIAFAQLGQYHDASDYLATLA